MCLLSRLTINDHYPRSLTVCRSLLKTAWFIDLRLLLWLWWFFSSCPCTWLPVTSFFPRFNALNKALNSSWFRWVLFPKWLKVSSIKIVFLGKIHLPWFISWIRKTTIDSKLVSLILSPCMDVLLSTSSAL